MPEKWANEFGEILPTFPQRPDLLARAISLLPQNMPGKATEGDDRAERVRWVLLNLVNGRLSLEEAYWEVSHQLPRHASRYADSNRVFPDGWEERLVRTQLSRLYNQATLEYLLDSGQTVCYVPHSSAEDSASPCSRQIAGEHHDAAELLRRLIQNYTWGRWTTELKIPNHPHCTHVVTPARR